MKKQINDKIKITIHLKNKENKVPKTKRFDLSKKKCLKHPTLGVKCHRHKVGERKIFVANLDQPLIYIYQVAQYYYYDPVTGKKHFFTILPPHVTGRKRHNNSTIILVTEEYLNSSKTQVACAKQSRNRFNLKTAPSTVYKWKQCLEIDQEDFDRVQEQVREKFSGHTTTDEVYDKNGGTIITTDPVNDTILDFTYVNFEASQEETECEDSLYDKVEKKKGITSKDIWLHFKKLFNKGFKLISSTTDGSPLYKKVPKQIFKQLIMISCIFHLIKSCITEFFKWCKQIRDEIKVEKQKRGRKKTSEDDGERGNKALTLKQMIFRARTLLVKARLSGFERNHLKTLFSVVPALREIRRCFLLFIKIFRSFTLDEAEKRYKKFIKDDVVRKNLPKTVKKLESLYKSGILFAYFQFSPEIMKCIRTSNHVERINRKLRKGQKTHYKVKKHENRITMLKYMQYSHNVRVLDRLWFFLWQLYNYRNKQKLG